LLFKAFFLDETILVNDYFDDNEENDMFVQRYKQKNMQNFSKGCEG